MGDPKFHHKKYSTPRHPWEKERIDEENKIVVKYGLKNKKEIWRSEALLSSIRSQARDLRARLRTNDVNAQKQLERMIKRLNRYKLLSENATLDDVLSLTVENILDRRLQTIVFRKNLAISVRQARQLITHGHISVAGRRVTVPGMLVEAKDEDTIAYEENSPVANELHPIRQALLAPAQRSAEMKEGQGEASEEGETDE
ncbi:probable 30S ribosomal protein S4 [Thermoplasma acidophilum]|uniref:Small ribosomal subunit protein uS4 n=1 Tax=Thermoplasma acidophilum (strain ATCC 25905 / DSM 1728 / JCM 9062 / NBRC 15155 / AMRC-C165) TaxID=273075 RepID=RS4_THEAC|nr:30S ribosomal protein S4 [Thermoplasma acidophilum]Q9HJD7.1 RecName: Full=Small ribosomal subunit protein uS4; AltName: Full=30S ribosomal protein S4 [Thermoplasma acidophilum DSM 1728]MCY0851765.1 30S ribosomal protein S4 [Thermoplasma acidophilum]CAC12161.1 probable 30S ribosomal protein S4 [Thermoplasma acidophilum]